MTLGDFDGRRNYSQLEVFLTRRVALYELADRELDARVRVGLGAIRSGSETAYLISTGPMVLWPVWDPRVWLEGGISAALLSRDRVDGLDIGKHFQFISELGLKFVLAPRFSVGYRLQHVSNAGTDSDNPGLDFATFEVSMHY